MFHGTQLTRPTALLSRILNYKPQPTLLRSNSSRFTANMLSSQARRLDSTVNARYFKVLKTVFQKMKFQHTQLKNKKLRKSLLYSIGRSGAFDYNTSKMAARLHKKYMLPKYKFNVNSY